MAQEELYQVLLAPVVSEKTSIASSYNQYIFKVSKSANKDDIRRAVELLFKVDVINVQTLNMKGKKKIFARKLGRRSSWKKAVVRIKEGQMIDISS